MHQRRVGVEEELLLVDPGTGQPRAVSRAVLRRAGTASEGGTTLDHEMQQEQVEAQTHPCRSLEELADELRRWRVAAADSARRTGVEVAALATSPVPVHPSTDPDPRYRRMVEAFGLTAEQQLTCGCHVHVEIASGEEGVAVIDRIRPWLPVLLALSANSPFWHGCDSGHASYRSDVWGRWPSAGPTGTFGSLTGYRATVRELLDSGTLLDEGMIYFDARLSRHHQTVEIRIADVCLDHRDTVLLAALTRALVETAARAWRAGELVAPVRTELLRVATWRAGKSGLRAGLVHPQTGRPVPAEVAVQALLQHVTPVLAESTELATVRELVRVVLDRGTGADAQRAAFEPNGLLADVVDHAVARTVPAPFP
jgi:carboxylate-amine ligase